MTALPSSRESEDALLSILIARPDRIDDAPDLSEGMFYHPGNRVIFAAIRRMRDNGTAIDSVVLMSALMAAGDLEKAGGAERVVGVMMPDTAPEHFLEYLATLRDCHMRRTAIVRLTELLGDAERAEDYRAIEDRIESGLSALVGMAHGGEDDPTMRETVI